jgi:hypothetical protein
LRTQNFTGRIDIIILNKTFQLHFSDCEVPQMFKPVSYAIAKYFNKKLSRCFYNYKNLKGFLGLILTKLYVYVSVTEMIHFEIGLTENPFYTQHSSQDELDKLMAKKNLNIEMVLDQFDFMEDGKYFSIKFIDPKIGLFRIVRFIMDDQNIIHPAHFVGPPYALIKNDPKYLKFLHKLLYLCTLNLNDLY